MGLLCVYDAYCISDIIPLFLYNSSITCTFIFAADFALRPTVTLIFCFRVLPQHYRYSWTFMVANLQACTTCLLHSLDL